MKRNFLLSAVLLATVFTSCNDDDNANNQTAELKLFTTSNTTGKVSSTDLLATNAATSVVSFGVNGLDNDGVYYDSDSDELIVASRTNNRLESYQNVKAAITANALNLTLGNISSNSDFSNPREIAVLDDKVIVTQDQSPANGNINKLLVYQRTASGFTLLNSYSLDFKVWGIHVTGSTLYAVADLTGDLVIFNNFFAQPSGNLTASKRVTIEGLTRTHGITYSVNDDVMILSDVASATDATDGGLIIINNFNSVIGSTANLGTIAMNAQIRIYGSNTSLGNPVDVAYDYESNIIYVAERANGGGQVLTFAMPTASGNIAPTSARAELGVAAVYLAR
ncbi:hypothetical protein [Flavobacterium sp.]|uniref:hypothetical protein n=1 Tax=Flavobacterium sp. TaxID=239 RepID=UPI003F6A3464